MQPRVSVRLAALSSARAAAAQSARTAPPKFGDLSCGTSTIQAPGGTSAPRCRSTPTRLRARAAWLARDGRLADRQLHMALATFIAAETPSNFVAAASISAARLTTRLTKIESNKGEHRQADILNAAYARCAHHIFSTRLD
jgi:hypothetical protein